MTRHVYPASALMGDYLRAAVGFVPAAAILATQPVSAAGAVVCGAFAALFGGFGLRTVLRHGTRIEMTETELRVEGPRRRAIAWADLDRLKLAYYSVHRDRRHGWMQLEIGANGTRLRLDSRIEGFDRLVERAAAAAAGLDLELSPTTLDNLHALGISPGASTGRHW